MSENFANNQVKSSFSNDTPVTFTGSRLSGGNDVDFTTSSNQDFWEDDGFSLTGNPFAQSQDLIKFNMSGSDEGTLNLSKEIVSSRFPGGLGEDHISPSTFNVNMPWNATLSKSIDTNKNGFWKYEEDKTLKEVEQYLSSTYHSHYTSETSKTQTLDLIESIGDAEAFTRSNAIKYLSRFGKKNGKSKQDILKAIHYCVLLYHFAGLHKNTTNTYNY